MTGQRVTRKHLNCFTFGTADKYRLVTDIPQTATGPNLAGLVRELGQTLLYLITTFTATLLVLRDVPGACGMDAS